MKRRKFKVDTTVAMMRYRGTVWIDGENGFFHGREAIAPDEPCVMVQFGTGHPHWSMVRQAALAQNKSDQ